MNARRTLIAVLVLSFLSSGASASPIISLTGPSTGNWSVYPGATIAVSWTSPHAYSDVTISAKLSGSATTGTASLTTQIGLGTTVAQELASASYATDWTTQEWVVLFSGLHLDPGTFYLTLGSLSPFGGWASANSPTIVRAPDVQFGGAYAATANDAAFSTSYWPDNPFQPFGAESPPVQFTVEGVVSEPSVVVLLCTGAFVAAARRHWRSR